MYIEYHESQAAVLFFINIYGILIDFLWSYYKQNQAVYVRQLVFFFFL